MSQWLIIVLATFIYMVIGLLSVESMSEGKLKTFILLSSWTIFFLFLSFAFFLLVRWFFTLPGGYPWSAGAQ